MCLSCRFGFGFDGDSSALVGGGIPEDKAAEGSRTPKRWRAPRGCKATLETVFGMDARLFQAMLAA